MDRDVVYVYNGMLLSYTKKEIMYLAATQMNLETTILSEVRKTNFL